MASLLAKLKTYYNNNNNYRENNVNGTGNGKGEGVTFGSGSGGQQPNLGRYQVTARLWNELGLFEITEQRHADQATAIRKMDCYPQGRTQDIFSGGQLEEKIFMTVLSLDHQKTPFYT